MYTTATLITKTQGEGVLTMLVGFTGNAGEVEHRATYVADFPNPTLAWLRQQVTTTMARLNGAKTLADSLTEGQAVTVVVPVDNTPRAEWLAKVRALVLMAELDRGGATSAAMTTALTSLRASVATDFRAAYLQD